MVMGLGNNRQDSLSVAYSWNCLALYSEMAAEYFNVGHVFARPGVIIIKKKALATAIKGDDGGR